jgi:hypothetical protein
MSPLSTKIQKEFHSLMKTVEHVPISMRTHPSIEGKSVNDIIAYQIGWGTLLIGWYEKGLLGQMPEMPGEGFTKWDYVGLAKHFAHKYRDLKPPLDQIVERLIDIVEHEDKSGNLNALGVWPWCTLRSGKLWPLSKWIQVNTVAPYRRANRFIKQNLSI